MARKMEDIRLLLAQKFQRESARLNSWGTKTDEKAAISFADSVVRFVQALMAESRYRELKRVFKKHAESVYKDKHKLDKHFLAYLQERMKATKAMAKAIEHVAEDAEKKRPWKYHKHEHKRSSRSSRH